MSPPTVRRNGLALATLLFKAHYATRAVRTTPIHLAQKESSSDFWLHIAISAALVLIGGVFAG